MRRGLLAVCFAAIGFAPRSASAAPARGMLDFEAGLAVVGRNEVRIPGAGATRFSLADDLSARTTPAFRVRVGYRFAERHSLSALYAPLTINATGRPRRDIQFAGATYAAGQPLLGSYRFDSYRLTYRYALVDADRLELWLGVTGKIRDAEIALYGDESSRKTNTGFVPLLNLNLHYRPFGGSFGLLLQADALAAPQGRAEDVLIAGTWLVREGLSARLGYRMLEGGADNDEVYNFAWIHYATAGLRATF